MLKYEFIIEWLWISTNDNVDADHLSRDREGDFLESVYKSGCWSSDTEPIRLVGAGAKRVLPEKRGAPPEPAPSLNPNAAAFEPVNMDALTYIKRAQAAGGSTYQAPAGASGLLSLTQGRGRHAEEPVGYGGSTSRPPPRARSPTGRRTPSSRSPSGALEARR